MLRPAFAVGRHTAENEPRDLWVVIRQYSSAAKSRQNTIAKRVSRGSGLRLCPHYIGPCGFGFSTRRRRISAISHARASGDIKGERSRCQIKEKQSAIDSE